MLRFNFLILLLFMTSCMDTGRDRSSAYKSTAYPYQVYNSPTGGESTSGGTTTIGTLPTATPDNTQVDPLVAETNHCSFATATSGSYTYQVTKHLGTPFNICQSQTEKNVVYIQLKDAISSVRVCLVPQYQSIQGYVTYSGEPQCQFLNVAGKITKYTLNLNRYPYISSVLILKDQQYYFPLPYNNQVNNIEAYLLGVQAYEIKKDPTFLNTYYAQEQWVYSVLKGYIDPDPI